MTEHRRIDPVTAITPRLCVAAGAGSGKTKTLIDRILHLLENHYADLDEIVAITFTDAAAAEMKVRLRKEFHRKAPADDPAGMTRWRDLERRADMARLSTIHSFCASLIRENALRAGWDPDFAVLAEAEFVLLRKETIEQTVHALLEQEAKSPAGDGPATRAAAMMGMTQLSSELDAMLNRGRLMGLVLEAGLPSDPEALAEQWRQLIEEAHRQRLLMLRDSGRLEQYKRKLEKFDGACRKPTDAREIGRIKLIAAIESIQRAKDANDIEAALQEVVSLNYRGARSANWAEEAYEKIGAVQKELKDLAGKFLPKPIDPETEARAAQLAADVRRVYENVAEAYKLKKKESSSADFDDLIQAAYEMLRDNEAVRAQTARGIKFLLIDEFQDTDSWQLQIARLLAEHPGGPGLFIVGDAKQSIYDFRGAEVEVFQDEKCAAEVAVLDKNYRTLPDVLEFINDTFERSGLLQAVEPQYAPLVPHRPAAGEPRVEFLVPPRDEEAKTPDYRAREAEMIAGRLDEMVRGPRPVLVADRDGPPRPAQFGDAAILFRAMSDVYLYEEALRRRGIPYHVVAGRGFYERQEIIDLRNLLSVVVDPCDEMALLGFLRSPLAGLSDEALVTISAGGGLLQGFDSDAVPASFREGEALTRARDLLSHLRARSGMPLAEFLRYALDETGFEAVALSQFLGMQKAYNIRKTVDLAHDFSRARPATIPAFLRYLEQAALDEVREGDAALLPEGAGAVTLMSVHKSKGLEFPIVYVADISRDQRANNRSSVLLHRRLGLGVKFPDSRGDTATPAICDTIQKAQAEKDEAEHARMLYVAMTRARDWLVLSGAPESKKSSWMSTFDNLYGVCGAGHGTVIRHAADTWSAVVRRECPADRPYFISELASSAGASRPETELWDALARQAEPVHNFPRARRTFSVAEVLDAMTETADLEEAREEQPPAAGAAAGDRMFRGTLVHRMFELWDFKAAPPVEEVLAEVADPQLRERLEPDLRAIAEKFIHCELSELFAQSNVRREMPFYLNVKGMLIHGVIDAMTEDGTTLVDYKTGRPGGKMAQRYELQLSLYAAALQQLLGRLPEQVFLYYADHGKAQEVNISENAVRVVLGSVADAIALLKAGKTKQ